jgi:hypothetical protein
VPAPSPGQRGSTPSTDESPSTSRRCASRTHITPSPDTETRPRSEFHQVRRARGPRIGCGVTTLRGHHASNRLKRSIPVSGRSQHPIIVSLRLHSRLGRNLEIAVNATRFCVGVCTLIMCGCTTMAPGAKEIPVTRNIADVQSCKSVGSLNSVPPYLLPGDDLKQLRNQAVGLGADTILVTSPRLVSTAGVAYRCKA